MKVELLYVPGCPNYRLAAARLKRLLASQGVLAQIHEVIICDHAMAEALKFPGSPTIRIDGKDIEPEGSLGTPGLACRLYHDPETRSAGLPSLGMIRRALRAHRNPEEA